MVYENIIYDEKGECMDKNIKNTNEYANIPQDEVTNLLSTSKDGLSTKKAEERIKEYGYNEIKEDKENAILAFLKRYWGPMPWLLEIAIILTVILHHYTESIMIFTLLTVNAIIGYFESHNSQKAVLLLKKNLEIKSKILRDGKWILKEARYIVPGDVIMCKLGDLIPADVYIIDGEISADESALTGESLPKDKKISDIIYSSSIVKGGEVKCIVINTGANTYFGKTVELVKIAKPKSKQEELMINIVKYMMYAGILASIIVSTYAIYLHKPLVLILTFIVTFLIGSIPVALPAVLSIVQAVGALQLSKKGVLVTKLDSIEDAASIDIFCFDKTGTITQNKLTVVDSVGYNNYSNDDVIKMAAFASKAEEMDAIDLAIIEGYKKIKRENEEYKQLRYTPFIPSTKRTEATVKINDKIYKITKGAVQTILELCAISDKTNLENITKQVDEFSHKGYRAIAVASADENENSYKFIGILAIADPPREDSKSLIELIKKSGIRTMMLTGDSIDIAKEIASEVGIGNKIMRLKDLENLKDDEKLKLIEECDGFAEVYPEDKYKIVKLLQESGHMVGMTGDGVNDAPTLKQAELGAAVSSATDVARASASIVLTKPGISEIVDAIKISRETYQRVLTWVMNKITKVIEIIVLFTISFFWFHDIVISLLGMSLLVFANDFITMSIATDKAKASNLPNVWRIKNITIASIIFGVLYAIQDLLVIYVSNKYFNLNFDALRTLVLLTLIFNTQFRILTLRERKHFWNSMPSKELLIINIITIIGFVLLGIYGVLITQVALNQVLITLLITIIFMFILDFIKYNIFKKLNV